jgi:hypothetical protein
VGFAILEHSKLKMYDLWYNQLKPHYIFLNRRLTLLMMDTDSIIYLAASEDIFEDMPRMNLRGARFDLTEHRMSTKYRKMIGSVKYEGAASKGEQGQRYPWWPKILWRYVGSQAKMYALDWVMVDQEELLKTEEGRALADHLFTYEDAPRVMSETALALKHSLTMKTKGVPQKAVKGCAFETMESIVLDPFQVDQADYSTFRSKDHVVRMVHLTKRRFS